MPLIDVMKEKVAGVFKSYSAGMLKSINAIENLVSVSESPKKKGPTGRGDDAIKYDMEQQKVKDTVAQLLEESESYFEKNLNAAANNMSFLTLSAFEITNYLEL